MLTIRVISVFGREMVKETSSVELRPASETARQRACLTYYEPKSGEDARAVEDIYDGTVYVMNENGKTIASYNLNLPEDRLTGSGNTVVGGSE